MMYGFRSSSISVSSEDGGDGLWVDGGRGGDVAAGPGASKVVG